MTKTVDERTNEIVDNYLDTIGRMEPSISMVDASAFYASAAISLKRIADAMDKLVEHFHPEPQLGGDE